MIWPVENTIISFWGTKKLCIHQDFCSGKHHVIGKEFLNEPTWSGSWGPSPGSWLNRRLEWWDQKKKKMAKEQTRKDSCFTRDRESGVRIEAWKVGEISTQISILSWNFKKKKTTKLALSAFFGVLYWIDMVLKRECVQTQESKMGRIWRATSWGIWKMGNSIWKDHKPGTWGLRQVHLDAQEAGRPSLIYDSLFLCN